jgi:hypothetical protein
MAVLVGEETEGFDSRAPVGGTGEDGVERVGRHLESGSAGGVVFDGEHGADEGDDYDEQDRAGGDGESDFHSGSFQNSFEVAGADEVDRSLGEELEAAEGFGAFALIEAREHGGDERGLEDLLLAFDAQAGGGEAELDAAGVLFAAGAGDVAAALEAVDGERHRGGRHAHVAGEVEERGGFDVVEMVEDGGLTGGEDGLRSFVADVAAVGGEVDLRVRVEDGFDVGGHGI